MSATPNTPTPSDPSTRPADAGLAQGERARNWKAEPSGPARSVFPNFSVPAPEAEAAPVLAPPPEMPVESATTALARAFVYRHLAQGFSYPSREDWAILAGAGHQETLRACLQELSGAEEVPRIDADGFDAFHDLYLAAFGHAARGGVPLNEIEYGDAKADALFQPHQLADLAGYYHAFGLKVSDDAAERHDHLSMELEFMSVLAAKEAYALERGAGADAAATCRDAQKNFLREHLGRWTPALERRVHGVADGTALHQLAAFLRAFVEADCARFGVPAGGADLALRPVDDAMERMCDACGLNRAPPGVAAEPVA